MSDIPITPAPSAGGEGDPAGLDDGIASLFGEQKKAVDPFGNDRTLLDVMEECKKEALEGRWVFERNWWRNLLYVLGRQWIYYDKKRGQWSDKRMAQWIPRPVTNKFAEATEALLAMMSSINLQVYARPVGTGTPNVAAAEVADEIEPFIGAEHRIEEQWRLADFWAIITGNSFLHPYWDPQAAEGEILVPFEQCQACQEVSSPQEIMGAGQVCPKCGSPMLGQAFDPTGAMIGETLNTGRGRTEGLSPFEVAFPTAYKQFDELPYLIRMRFRPERWYKDTMPELHKKLKFQDAPTERSLQLLRALANQTDNSGLLSTFGFGGAQEPHS